jgi:single-stranded-DNA-specific exonuclease|tara:strand:- start:54 stop:1745 length:1692 start_codon:yes stop_codon:yes gene_type:complete
MRWTLKPKPDSQKVAEFSAELGVDLAISELLLQRGIDTFQAAKTFFRPSWSDLHDPFLMKDMDAAVARVESALKNNEQILVYGDYDVDGTSSVALMASYLDTKSSHISTYIPDRYDEGYGISYKGIDYASDNAFSLIIALDCGVKAIDKVAYAKSKGIDFIICDHHRPGKKLPPAVAILDPKRPDCEYPFKELCGCGVGFKLIQALASKDGQSVESLEEYLDLVATAIGADIVPIVGENRALAYFGLQVINSNPRPGFKALINQMKKEVLTITDVVFNIAPRINAAGRMKHGNYAVSLMKETSLQSAEIAASEIEDFNTNRRETDKRITQEALQQIETANEADKASTVVYQEDWHKGVIGIVASRLIETYYRPTLVFTKSGDYLAASARSVSGFDVYNALENCSHLVEQFGGHMYAAGLTIKEENYPAFKAAFEAEVLKTLPAHLKFPEIKIDSEINFESITPKFFRILKQFAPFGPQNLSPVFMTSEVYDTGYGKCVGEDQTHLRVTLTQKRTPKIVGIGFGLGAQLPIITSKNAFKTVYSIDENEWNGRVSLQLKLKDLKL